MTIKCFGSLLQLFSQIKQKRVTTLRRRKKVKLLETIKKCADTFNIYFNSVVKDQKVSLNKDRLKNFIKVDDPILTATEKYMRHTSILKIKEKAK